MLVAARQLPLVVPNGSPDIAVAGNASLVIAQEHGTVVFPGFKEQIIFQTVVDDDIMDAPAFQVADDRIGVVISLWKQKPFGFLLWSRCGNCLGQRFPLNDFHGLQKGTAPDLYKIVKGCFAANFPGKPVPFSIGSPVHHGHKDSVDFQFWIDLPPHSADGADQQIQTLCGKKVRRRRDDHAVGGSQSIDGHQAQRRHTVNENVVVVLFHPAENGFQHLLPGHGIEQAHFHAGQFNVRRKQIDPLAAVDDTFFPGNGFIPDFCLHGSSQCGIQIIVSVPYS